MSPNGLDHHPAFLNTLSDVVVPDVNMLALIMEDGILAGHDCGLIVDLQRGCPGLLALELYKKPR